MYSGSEIFESGFSLQEKNKFVLDIKCTVIGKLTDNMVLFFNIKILSYYLNV